MRLPLVYHPAYSAPLPSSHRFPMAKFKLLRALLEEQGLAREEQIHTPLRVPRRSLELIHSRRYHQAFARGELLPAEQRRIGLPASLTGERDGRIEIGAGRAFAGDRGVETRGGGGEVRTTQQKSGRHAGAEAGRTVGLNPDAAWALAFGADGRLLH